MDILFRTRKDEKLFNDFNTLKRKLGKQRANQITNRLALFRSARTLEDLRRIPGHMHELKSDRRGQLAIDVSKNERLVFEPADDPPPTKPDGGLDWNQVTAVRILEVVDYHD